MGLLSCLILFGNSCGQSSSDDDQTLTGVTQNITAGMTLSDSYQASADADALFSMIDVSSSSTTNVLLGMGSSDVESGILETQFNNSKTFVEALFGASANIIESLAIAGQESQCFKISTGNLCLERCMTIFNRRTIVYSYYIQTASYSTYSNAERVSIQNSITLEKVADN